MSLPVADLRSIHTNWFNLFNYTVGWQQQWKIFNYFALNGKKAAYLLALCSFLAAFYACPANAALTETISPVLSNTLTAVLRDHQSGQFPQARQRLYRFLKQYPKHPVATAALADLYMREVQQYRLSHLALPSSDRQERASIQNLLQQAFAQYPDHPRLLAAWQRWQFLFNTSRIQPSALVWQNSYQPKQLKRYQDWAQTLLSQNDLHAAKQVAMVALELEPTHPVNYLAIAEVLLASDQPQEAERFFQQATLLGMPQINPRLLALKGRLQEAQLDQVPADTPAPLPTMDLLDELHTKKLAVTMEALHAMLPQARREADTAQLWEALTAAGIHLQRSGKTVNPGLIRQYAQELNDVLKQPLAYPEKLQLSAERLKQLLGQPTNYAALAQSKDDFVSGQALFLNGQFAQANERLDAIDGVTPQGYQSVADILMLEHAFVMAETMARRGLQMGELPNLRNILLAIEQQRELSRKLVRYGDVDAQRKDWSSAQKQYELASQINPEWETPYLRLGELWIKLKKPTEAYTQYSKAVKLSPSLLTSPAFNKRYQKLSVKAAQPMR